MEGFGSVVGHEEIIAHLQSAIRGGKVSHSYIFAGENGSGKKLLANLLAMTLQCEEGGIEPCLKCASCKKAMGKNHPDIIHVVHEKPGTISVDEIRSQVVSDVEIKPYNGPRKIYIISDAERMTPQAQNALLKTIEEPPSYAVILLLVSGTDALLPTIVSRCVVLQLKAVNDDLVKKYLTERLHIPDYQAQMSASFAQGNVGRAKQISTSEEFSELTEQMLKLLRHVDDMELFELVDAVRKLSDQKGNIGDVLDLIQIWYRDVLLFKATREVDNLMFKQEINYIKEDARERSYEGLENIMQAVDRAKARLKANVNFELTMELLFLTIREK